MFGSGQRSIPDFGNEAAASPLSGSLTAEGMGQRPLKTGRTIVVFRDEPDVNIRSILRNKAGVAHVSSAADSTSHVLNMEEVTTGAGAEFPNLKIAVVGQDPDAFSALRAYSDPANGQVVLVVEELINYPINGGFLSPPPPFGEGPLHGFPQVPIGATMSSPMDYLRGYHDAVTGLYRGMLGGGFPIPIVQSSPLSAATASGDFTWGLQVTGVADSPLSGAGINVAILDSGFDLGHSDFDGREIVAETMIPTDPVQDRLGHGTHCVGTACGPRQRTGGPGYGVAHRARIHVGKVLGRVPGFADDHVGPDGIVINGIDWAIERKCRVVSMSLGRQAPDDGLFDAVGLRAERRQCLLVAAAGNESNRYGEAPPSFPPPPPPGTIRPVARPANSKPILAVGALEQLSNGQFRVANFSNQSSDGGGAIDVAGPGVRVLSSFLGGGHRELSGTSMATPHVAGVVALLMEAFPGFSANQIKSRLLESARRLPLPSADVGAGLVRVPTGLLPLI